jgi:hypothetical protein
MLETQEQFSVRPLWIAEMLKTQERFPVKPAIQVPRWFGSRWRLDPRLRRDYTARVGVAVARTSGSPPPPSQGCPHTGATRRLNGPPILGGRHCVNRVKLCIRPLWYLAFEPDTTKE